MGCNLVVVLPSRDHFVVLPNFFSLVLLWMFNSFYLFNEGFLFGFEFFIANMRLDYLLVSFRMNFDFKSQELRVLALDVDDSRFLFRYFQLEPFFEPLRDCILCLFSRRFRPAKYSEIVSVAHLSPAHCSETTIFPAILVYVGAVGKLKLLYHKELTDAQWGRIKCLFEEQKKVGRPPLNPRKALNGILWILRTGARWRDLPARFEQLLTVINNDASNSKFTS